MGRRLNQRRFWFGNRRSRFYACSYRIGEDDDPYMFRWIFRTPWCSFRVHKIMRSDRADALHDHPMSFLVLLVNAGYWEVLATSPTTTSKVWRRRGSVRWIPAERPHRLVLEKKPVWTLSIAFRKDRPWGFYPKRYDADGFVPEAVFLRFNERGQ